MSEKEILKLEMDRAYSDYYVQQSQENYDQFIKTLNKYHNHESNSD